MMKCASCYFNTTMNLSLKFLVFTLELQDMSSAISLVAMIPRCQRGGPSSILGWRTFCLFHLFNLEESKPAFNDNTGSKIMRYQKCICYGIFFEFQELEKFYL